MVMMASLWRLLGLKCTILAALSIASATSNEGTCNHHDSTEHEHWIRTPGAIIDISKELAPSTVDWDSPHGLQDFIERFTKIEKGDPANQSRIKQLSVHTATHVDSPGHWLHDYYETGKGTESLDLYKLNGPVLVVDVEFDMNITAAVMEHLMVPEGIHRLIFRTQNTARGLMHETAFASDYVALTKDGAEWIVNNTAIDMVGIDYTSIATYEDLPGPHHVLLSKDIAIVEGLVLDHVEPGIYQVHCLHLKLVGSDGSPARCILIA